MNKTVKLSSMGTCVVCNSSTFHTNIYYRLRTCLSHSIEEVKKASLTTHVRKSVFLKKDS